MPSTSTGTRWTYSMYSDLDKRIKWMDEHGVQMHVLSLDGSAPWAWASAEQGIGSRKS